MTVIMGNRYGRKILWLYGRSLFEMPLKSRFRIFDCLACLTQRHGPLVQIASLQKRRLVHGARLFSDR